MRVIVRADFDVPIRGGKVQDDTRIRAHEATLRALASRSARIRIVAHRGRPGGIHDSGLSLAPASRALSRLLRRRVVLASDPFSSAAYERFNDTEDIVVFENIRFWPGEEKNAAAFARSLAQWGDSYVNEAFANCHRVHASMVGLPKLLPAFAGIHLADEVAALGRVMKNPKRPLVAILGGAKIETKLPLITRFLRDADHVLIGGALANTIFSYMGKRVGKSRIDKGVRMKKLLFSHKKLCIPDDVVVTSRLAAGSAYRVCGVDDVALDEYIVDIGPATQTRFASYIRAARTVVWNGPMGLAEIPAFAAGTKVLSSAVARSRAFSVVGGGDTIAALRRLKILSAFSHVSTGGGAMLEFLAGEKLSALELLKK